MFRKFPLASASLSVTSFQGWPPPLCLMKALLDNPTCYYPGVYRSQNLTSSHGGKLTHGQELQERPALSLAMQTAVISPQAHAQAPSFLTQHPVLLDSQRLGGNRHIDLDKWDAGAIQKRPQ